MTEENKTTAEETAEEVKETEAAEDEVTEATPETQAGSEEVEETKEKKLFGKRYVCCGSQGCDREDPSGSR